MYAIYFERTCLLSLVAFGPTAPTVLLGHQPLCVYNVLSFSSSLLVHSCCSPVVFCLYPAMSPGVWRLLELLPIWTITFRFCFEFWFPGLPVLAVLLFVE